MLAARSTSHSELLTLFKFHGSRADLGQTTNFICLLLLLFACVLQVHAQASLAQAAEAAHAELQAQLERRAADTEVG